MNNNIRLKQMLSMHYDIRKILSRWQKEGSERARSHFNLASSLVSAINSNSPEY